MLDRSPKSDLWNQLCILVYLFRNDTPEPILGSVEGWAEPGWQKLGDRGASASDTNRELFCRKIGFDPIHAPSTVMICYFMIMIMIMLAQGFQR